MTEQALRPVVTVSKCDCSVPRGTSHRYWLISPANQYFNCHAGPPVQDLSINMLGGLEGQLSSGCPSPGERSSAVTGSLPPQWYQRRADSISKVSGLSETYEPSGLRG